MPNTARNAPEGDAHRKKSGYGRTPIGTICTPIFAPFGDAHSIRPLTVGSSGFALFTYGYSKKPPSGTAVARYTSKTLPRQPQRRRESPKGAALNNRRRGGAQRRRTYGCPTPQGTPPKGTPIGKSGHVRTPTGTICTPIFAPFGDAHSIRLLTVGSSGFALFTYGYSKKPPSGTVVAHSICTWYVAKKFLRRRQ